MKLEYQIESKNFVLILNKILLILILCIFGIFLLKILTFYFSSQIYQSSNTHFFGSLQQVFIFLFFIVFLHIQRQPFEGGIVRQLSEQRFFVRYQNSELFIYCLSFLLSF